MLLGMKKYTFTPSLVPFHPWLWILAFLGQTWEGYTKWKKLKSTFVDKIKPKLKKCAFFHYKQHSKLSFWDLMPLKTCFDIKTDICDQNLDNSQNPYVAKFQKWPRMLCIDPLEGPRRLISFAIFFTPLSRHFQTRGVINFKQTPQVP